jgi:hypothetical protein
VRLRKMENESDELLMMGKIAKSKLIPKCTKLQVPEFLRRVYPNWFPISYREYIRIGSHFISE